MTCQRCSGPSPGCITLGPGECGKREDERQILEERASERDFPALTAAPSRCWAAATEASRLTCAASPLVGDLFIVPCARIAQREWTKEEERKARKKRERLLKLSLQITTVRTKEQQSWQSLKAGSRV